MDIVCVLDLDETLGYFDEKQFNIRPNVDFLLKFLNFSNISIILWSYGTDSYVQNIINSYFHNLVKFAYKIFGRTQCHLSEQRYNVIKCSEHIRKMYTQDILLIGIDDRVNEMMDNRYDLRISVAPYNKKNENDTELIKAIEKIVDFFTSHS